MIACRPKDKTLKPKLVKLAKADKRTLSNYIEQVLQKHVDEHSATKGKQ